MGKRHPHLPAWQWRVNPQTDQHSAHWALQLIAAPLFIIAFMLMVSGVFSASLPSLAIGIVGLVAALGLQRHGHGLEA